MIFFGSLAIKHIMRVSYIPDVVVISTTINKLAQEYFLAWIHKNKSSFEVWTCPQPPYYKINYDTAIRSSFSAQAAVCRNSSDTIIGCQSLIRPPYSVIFGEATATLLAVRLAISLWLSSFILEGDSLNVTLALQHLDLTTD